MSLDFNCLREMLNDDSAIVGPEVKDAPDFDDSCETDLLTNHLLCVLKHLLLDILDVWQIKLQFLQGFLDLDRQDLFLLDVKDVLLLVDQFRRVLMPAVYRTLLDVLQLVEVSLANEGSLLIKGLEIVLEGI